WSIFLSAKGARHALRAPVTAFRMIEEVSFPQVELALDAASCLVLELAGAKEVVDVAPFLADEEHFELVVRFGNPVLSDVAVDVMKTLAMAREHRLDHI